MHLYKIWLFLLFVLIAKSCFASDIDHRRNQHYYQKAMPFVGELSSIGQLITEDSIYLNEYSYRRYFTLPNLNDDFYTVINSNHEKLLDLSQRDISRMLQNSNQITVNSPNYLNQLLEMMTQYYINHPTPYSTSGAQGEGYWCDQQLTQVGCFHIQQDPIYRTDSLDCNTLVQLIMGLVGSQSIQEFKKNLININYGVAVLHNLPLDQQGITYANRNNFISADFNPVNEKNGRLKNVTSEGNFARIAKTVTARIDRANWFKFQARDHFIGRNVRVLSAQSGLLMNERLKNDYGNFYKPEKISIDYIPKYYLVEKKVQANGAVIYVPNDDRINQIQTPAVVEIVRDVNQWEIKGMNIIQAIGSGINISHVAMLYKHFFDYNEEIYQDIQCDYDQKKNKICSVKPVKCENKLGCTKTMMLSATSAYPNGYLWSYNASSKTYACTNKNSIPVGNVILTTCDRVSAMPLGDYLARNFYGRYLYMDSDSIVGIHVEKLMPYYNQ